MDSLTAIRSVSCCLELKMGFARDRAGCRQPWLWRIRPVSFIGTSSPKTLCGNTRYQMRFGWLSPASRLDFRYNGEHERFVADMLLMSR